MSALPQLAVVPRWRGFISVFVLAGLWAASAGRAAEPPTEWIDSDTGHRVVRLSPEPDTASLYFHQNAYTPDGRKLIVTTSGAGIATIDLRTRAVRQLADGPVSVLVAGRTSGDVYYTKRPSRDEMPAAGGPPAATVYATNAESGVTRKVVDLPPGVQVASLNADETMLLGSTVARPEGPRSRPAGEAGEGPARSPQTFQVDYRATGPDGRPLTFAEAKEVRLHESLQQARSGSPRQIVTVDTRTGAMQVVHQEREWLNHLQFSPTDPDLIMFCHEGPWHEVDRIWTVRTDGTGLTRIHTRTMNMEIAGHEFFAADGKTIWYDLQTPRGEDFWVAGYTPATGHRTWYHLQRNEWSVHFNVSPDGTLFAGDGGDSEMVAHAPDGKWIYLYRREGIPDVAGISNPDSASLIDPGVLVTEPLVNMTDHDYRLEPNVSFTPDQQWVVFRSNMHGAVHTYMVEIAKAQQPEPTAPRAPRPRSGRGRP